jgi:CheY-like chemotaxis protein
MRFDSPTILHIDDDRKFLKSTERLFKPKNYSIKGVTSGAKGIKLLKESYYNFDLVLVDLDLPEMDGVEIFKSIRLINEQIPVFFLSAHFGEVKWDRKLKTLNTDVRQIKKPIPMITSGDFLKIENMLMEERRRYIEELHSPFRYSLTDFMKLSDGEMDAVFNKASEVNSKFVENYFEQNLDKDWIVIAKEPGYIIASGVNADEPFEEVLWKLSQEIDAPVFTYSRGKIIEQINNCWSCKSNPDDYYPTVTLGFISKGGHQTLQGDFDTGSNRSFFSYEEIMKMGVLDRKPQMQTGSRVLWDKSYTYFRAKLKCTLFGNSKVKDIELKCELVKNWQDGPLLMHYGNRVALIGRNLLLDNKVKMVLDGDKKETDII